MPEFTEIADRVWLARYEWFDVNIALIGGERGLAVVDTHASTRQAAMVIDDIERAGVGEVVEVVNTHWHFDHSFGNSAFRARYGAIPIHAHEAARDELAEFSAKVITSAGEDSDPRAAEIAETQIVLPDHTFSSVSVIDLGDRVVELIHPGRGHTGGDLVVNVPEVDVVFGGDLIEESAAPALGDDCWPMDWPLTLDVVLGMLRPETLVVPGHGQPVDREFVENQRNDIGILAEIIRDLAGNGVAAADALGRADLPGEFPWEKAQLAHAFSRGYEHLPRSQKRLPLI